MNRQLHFLHLLTLISQFNHKSTLVEFLTHIVNYFYFCLILNFSLKYQWNNNFLNFKTLEYRFRFLLLFINERFSNEFLITTATTPSYNACWLWQENIKKRTFISWFETSEGFTSSLWNSWCKFIILFNFGSAT
jgi:hypothetical protein